LNAILIDGIDHGVAYIISTHNKEGASKYINTDNKVEKKSMKVSDDGAL
jgi:hypothetical protein